MENPNFYSVLGISMASTGITAEPMNVKGVADQLFNLSFWTLQWSETQRRLTCGRILLPAQPYKAEELWREFWVEVLKRGFCICLCKWDYASMSGHGWVFGTLWQSLLIREKDVGVIYCYQLINLNSIQTFIYYLTYFSNRNIYVSSINR